MSKNEAGLQVGQHLNYKKPDQKFFENQGKLLSVEQLADRLGVSPKTIYGWTYKKIIPFKKIGPRLIRFDIEKIEQWIASQNAKE